MELNHIVFIVMDSCRFDSFEKAKTPNIDRLGAVQKRHSYASWTAPSHYAFTMSMHPPPNFQRKAGHRPAIGHTIHRTWRGE